MKRQPGTDAFLLVRQANRGQVFPAGECIEGLEQLRILASDVDSDSMAQHDTDPKYHPLAWITTAPEHCYAIQGTATAIHQKYGDRIHETPASRPSEANFFLAAVDSLDRYTGGLFDRIYGLTSDISEDKLAITAAMKKLDRYVNKTMNKAMLYRDPNNKFFYYSSLRLFGELNLLEAGWFGDTKEHRRIARAYASHMATLLLRSDEIRPSEDEARDSRLAFWRQIATDYADAQPVA